MIRGCPCPGTRPGSSWRPVTPDVAQHGAPGASAVRAIPPRTPQHTAGAPPIWPSSTGQPEVAAWVAAFGWLAQPKELVREVAPRHRGLEVVTGGDVSPGVTGVGWQIGGLALAGPAQTGWSG